MKEKVTNNPNAQVQDHESPHVHFDPSLNRMNSAPKQEIKSSTLKTHLKTMVATLASVLGSVGLGTVHGYTSPALPNLNESISPFHLDTLEISIVVGIASLGSLLGALFGGFLSDKCGRKFCIMVTSAAFALAWLLITSSTNVYSMCTGRLLTGFCGGVMDVAVPIYIAEIAPSDIRGLFGSCYELGTSFGILYVYAFGCFLPWNWLALSCMCIPALQALLMVWMPESPRWLLSKGHKEDALEALNWFYGEEEMVSKVLEEMDDNIKLCSGEVQWTDLVKPPLLRAVLIVTGLVFFMQVSGDSAMVAFLVSIFASADFLMDPYLLTTVFGVAGLVSNIVCGFLVDNSGRRMMLFLSSAGMATCLAGLASFFLAKRHAFHFTLQFLGWLPVASLILYNFSFSLGFGPIPFYMACELFPLRARGLTTGVAISLMYIFQFVIASTFPHLINAFAYEGVYFLYATLSLVGGVFVYFFVPETMGKSLEEIEGQLRSGVTFSEA